MNPRLLPFAGFVALFALLGAGLVYNRTHDPSAVPSPLVGKPAPRFALPRLDAPELVVDSRSFRGKPYALHVFASWCYVCREESAVLARETPTLGIPMIGYDYKDDPVDAKRWLAQYGNPYAMVLADLEGDVAIDLGVYGAPELFLIDADGRVRHKYIGPLTSEAVVTELRPVIDRMRREATP